MISLKSLINEAFDDVFNFLLNPEHDNTEWYDLIRKFESSGGKVLGQGKYATAMEHPSWKYILKVFRRDAHYIKFVRFVLKNPRPSFPVFYDKPRKIIPHFKRFASEPYLYIVKTEKLEHIDWTTFNEIESYLYYEQTYIDNMITTSGNSGAWVELKKRIKGIESKHPSLLQFKKDYKFLMDVAENEEGFGSLDMHQKNIMKRHNGEFVLSDPFWEGMSLHQMQAQVIDVELDYNDDDSPSPMVVGGKLPRRKKIHKPKQSIKPDSDPVPF
jgi:hypothetical protein